MTPTKALSTNHDNSKSRGFSLIELLIVIAIVGILGALAYPQYGEIVKKSRRADAQVAMLQEVQTLERCKSTNYSYTGCTLSSTTSPEDHYTMSLVSTASTYTVTATAKGKQAEDSDCATMTINQQGVRTPAESNGCWPD